MMSDGANVVWSWAYSRSFPPYVCGTSPGSGRSRQLIWRSRIGTRVRTDAQKEVEEDLSRTEMIASKSRATRAGGKKPRVWTWKAGPRGHI